MGNKLFKHEQEILTLYLKTKESCQDWQFLSVKIIDEKNSVKVSVGQGSNISYFIAGQPLPHCGIISQNNFELTDNNNKSKKIFKFCSIHCVKQKEKGAKIMVHFCHNLESAQQCILNVIGMNVNQLNEQNNYQSDYTLTQVPINKLEILVNTTVSLELDWQVPIKYSLEEAQNNFDKITNCKRFLQSSSEFLQVKLDQQFFNAFTNLSLRALKGYAQMTDDNNENVQEWQNLDGNKFAKNACVIF